MSEPTTVITRDVLKAIAASQGIKLDPDDIAIFFEGRGWLALQQRMAAGMNVAYDKLESVSTDVGMMRFCQGFLYAIRFLQDSEASLTAAAKHETPDSSEQTVFGHTETTDDALLAIFDRM